jgi:starch synthase (maltosyl-transferring)
VASAARKAPGKKIKAAAPRGSPVSDDPPVSDGTSAIAEGRERAVIDAVLPTVDCGRFPAKRVVGEAVEVEAHCFTDGHDRIRAVLRWKMHGSAGEEAEIDMRAQPNDVWLAQFTPSVPGRYRYTVIAWVDHFESWRHELERREDPADIRVALRAGAVLIDEAAARASGTDAMILKDWSGQLLEILKSPVAAATADPKADAPADSQVAAAAQKALALDPARAAIVARHSDRSLAAHVSRDLLVDRRRAAFSSWYELFPRSAAQEPG